MTSPAPASLRQHARHLLALAGPLVLTQLGAMGLGVVDTLMLGHVGIPELDAAALGNVWLFGTLVFGMGVMMGLDPLVSQAFGAQDTRKLALTLQRGIVVAVLTSVPVAGVWMVTGPALELLGQDPSLARAAHKYVWIQIPSVAPFLVYFALRGYLQGRRIVAPSLWIMVVANALNVLGNWVLIWGNLGLPAMGLEGAGLASALTRGFLCVGTAGWIWAFGLHRGAWIPWSREAFSSAGLREICRHGIPVGLQIGLEAWAFQISTLVAGLIGVSQLAAHAIAINLCSVSFMLPLGISMAAATTIGNFLGEHRYEEAQRSAWVSYALGAGVMCASAIAFISLRAWFPTLYTQDRAVIEYVIAILPIAAAFQIFDGTQVVGGAILRGMGDARPAVIFNLIGYYVLGLPIGAYLALSSDWGLRGIWWALCLGLASIAILLVFFVHHRGPSSLVKRRRAAGLGQST